MLKFLFNLGGFEEKFQKFAAILIVLRFQVSQRVVFR